MYSVHSLNSIVHYFNLLHIYNTHYSLKFIALEYCQTLLRYNTKSLKFGSKIAHFTNVRAVFASDPIQLLAGLLDVGVFDVYSQDLYARYLCSRDALGLKAEQPAGQARRATIGYLVYNPKTPSLAFSAFRTYVLHARNNRQVYCIDHSCMQDN